MVALMHGSYVADDARAARSPNLAIRPPSSEDGRMPQNASITDAGPPVVAPLAERDLPEAERIFRVAFGTFLGVPEPETFWSDRDYVYGRWRAPHVAALGAALEGQLVGSNFATKWGSGGFFGPLTVRPDLRQRGIARHLVGASMERFEDWGTRHAGLFTFAQ